MPTHIFVNMHVKDLAKSNALFEKLGYRFDPQFTDDNAACLVISDDIYAMLLTHARFQEFTPNTICDATKTSEVLIALSRENRQQIDDMVKNAVAAGGNTYADPKDYGFMYQHGFQDPDGHIWELFYMEPGVVQQNEQ